MSIVQINSKEVFLKLKSQLILYVLAHIEANWFIIAVHHADIKVSHHVSSSRPTIVKVNTKEKSSFMTFKHKVQMDNF